MNAVLVKKVKSACAKDPSIITSQENLSSAPGYSEAYFAFLGLDTADLKSLESGGFATRGYKDFSTGRQVRWILVARE